MTTRTSTRLVELGFVASAMWLSACARIESPPFSLTPAQEYTPLDCALTLPPTATPWPTATILPDSPSVTPLPFTPPPTLPPRPYPGFPTLIPPVPTLPFAAYVGQITPYPTSTPIPTPAIPPTLTPPPGLRVWATPGPPPLSAQAEVARQCLSLQAGIPVAQLSLEWEMTILHPSTGEELWVGQFEDMTSGYYFEVSVSPLGQVASLPDFSTQAVSQVAQQTGIPAEQLIVANKVYAVFPLTHQIVWRAVIMDTRSGFISKGDVNLDLAGNSIDIAAIEAAEEATRRAQPSTPTSSPITTQATSLDTNIIFALEEVNGQVILKMRTEKIYGCANYSIDAHLNRPSLQGLKVVIKGIYRPEMCLNMIGPAYLDINLGQPDGMYDLTFVYEEMQDRYHLTTSPDRLTVQAIEAQFTWPKYETWLRLPPDSVWFIASAYPWNEQITPIAVDRSAYEAEVEQFFATVEALGAAPFTPSEGIYTNRRFAPPWPSWWQWKWDIVQMPLDDYRWRELQWPDIRYYHYSGPLAKLQALVQNDSEPLVGVLAYTSNGPLHTGEENWPTPAP
jgi:hypothetical protein